MSWLKDQKAERDKEAAEKKAREDAEERQRQARHERCLYNAERFYKEKLADLEGKTVTLPDRKKAKLRSVLDGTLIHIYANSTKLAYLRFSYNGTWAYDSDGGGYPTGEYEEENSMVLYLPWKDSCGEEKQPDLGGRRLYERDFATYLLNFVKV